MPAVTLVDRVFAATMENVSALVAELSARCEERGLAPGLSMRVTLVAEELTSNLVRHGYAGVGSFAVSIEQHGPDVRLLLLDTARAFDPGAGDTPAHIDLPV